MLLSSEFSSALEMLVHLFGGVTAEATTYGIVALKDLNLVVPAFLSVYDCQMPVVGIQRVSSRLDSGLCLREVETPQ